VRLDRKRQPKDINCGVRAPARLRLGEAAAQSLNALGQAYLLVRKDHVLRLDAPESPRPIALDDHRRAKEELPAMARSLVEGAGREVERMPNPTSRALPLAVRGPDELCRRAAQRD